MNLLADPFVTSPIGSRNESLRVYRVMEPEVHRNWRVPASQLLFVTGCFAGAEKQFRAAILASYPDETNQHRLEYLAAIEAAREHYR